ncbi:hypothetical protein [Actinoplanes philippinensis]|uniref:hypothetical protein n=1 Tax=Actinoplanes philippinensis TaxID=35752 RepID=UPI00340A3529
MDLDDTTDAALDRLLARADASALTTLNARNDVTQRLQELYARPTPPPTDESGEAVS